MDMKRRPLLWATAALALAALPAEAGGGGGGHGDMSLGVAGGFGGGLGGGRGAMSIGAGGDFGGAGNAGMCRLSLYEPLNPCRANRCPRAEAPKRFGASQGLPVALKPPACFDV
ncbi:MAG: hypothetical protein ACLQF1_14545 [Methyloceanibacter sp.]